MRFKIGGLKIHVAAVFGASALACLAAYIAFRAPLFGAAALAFLLSAIAADLLFGNIAAGGEKEKSGRELKKLALEIGATAAVAVAAWLALCFALQTSSPLNVVTSCSMLPRLERGDFIILQGGGIKAQEVQVPFRLSETFTQPTILDARKQGKRYSLAYSTFLLDENGKPHSFANYSFADCVKVPLDTPFGLSVNGASTESEALEACASGVSVNNVFFSAANENDVVVYEAQPSQYGLIIHRVLARIRAPDGVFYLTKGDNNQFADQQLGINVVPESAVKGRVVARIPFIGYFKLLLFLQFDFPAGCDSMLRYFN
ncbi:MAG: S26 family signal peptidase [Candidatus Norongarragalinales archaeon]